MSERERESNDSEPTWRQYAAVAVGATAMVVTFTIAVVLTNGMKMEADAPNRDDRGQLKKNQDPPKIVKDAGDKDPAPEEFPWGKELGISSVNIISRAGNEGGPVLYTLVIAYKDTPTHPTIRKTLEELFPNRIMKIIRDQKKEEVLTSNRLEMHLSVLRTADELTSVEINLGRPLRDNEIAIDAHYPRAEKIK